MHQYVVIGFSFSWSSMSSVTFITLLLSFLALLLLSSLAHLDEQFLQFSRLGFVTLGTFHCAQIYLCLSVCILCVFVSDCIVVVLL